MTAPPVPDDRSGADRSGAPDEVLARASAHLDGEGPPAPDAPAGWTAAASALGATLRDVPPPPVGLVDEHVRAALAATSGPAREAVVAPVAPVAPVASLGEHRARRGRALVLAAAAAAVVVLGTISVMATSGTGEEDRASESTSGAAVDPLGATANDADRAGDAVTKSVEVAPATGGYDAAGGGAGPSDGSGATMAPEAARSLGSILDLGTQPDAATAVRAWEQLRSASTADDRASAPSTTAAGVPAPSVPGTDSLAAAACAATDVVATARIADRTVLVVTDASGARVVDATTCRVVAP